MALNFKDLEKKTKKFLDTVIEETAPVLENIRDEADKICNNTVKPKVQDATTEASSFYDKKVAPEVKSILTSTLDAVDRTMETLSPQYARAKQDEEFARLRADLDQSREYARSTGDKSKLDKVRAKISERTMHYVGKVGKANKP